MSDAPPQDETEQPALRRHVLIAGAVVLLAAVAAAVTLFALRGNDKPQKGDLAAVADQMMAEADQIRYADPQRSLRLQVAAEQLDPHQRRRSDLARTLIAPRARGSASAGDGYITALAIAPDGRTVLVGGARTELWSVDDPAAPAKLSALPASADEVSEAVFVPDGRLILAERSALTYWDVRDPTKPRRIATLFESAELLGDVAATADGQRVVVAAGETAVVLDIRRPDAVSTMAVLPAGDTVYSVAISPDHRTAYVGHWGSEDAEVTVWDVPAKNRYGPVAWIALDGYAGEISLDPDGRLAIIGDDEHAEVWDFTNRADPRRVGTLGDHTSPIQVAAISDDTRTVLSISPQSAILWDLTEPSRPRYVASLYSNTEVLTAAAMNRDGSVALTGDRDGNLLVWDLRSARMLRTGDLRPVATGGIGIAQGDGRRRSEGADVTLSPDGSRAATIIDVQGPVVLWDTGSPRAVRRLAQLKGAAERALFNSDGTVLLTGTVKGGAALWDVRDARKPRRLADLPAKGILTASALNTDRGLAVTGATGGVVTLWDIADRATPRKLTELRDHGNWVPTLALSPDGTKLLVADLFDTVTYWDLAEPANPKKIGVLPGHPGSASSLSFGVDGRTAITTDRHGTAYQWDLPSAPSAATELTPRANLVADPAEEPFLWQERIAGGQIVVFGGQGQAGALWLLSDGGPVWLTEIPSPDQFAYRPGWSQDGRTVAIASGSPEVLSLWSLAALDDVVKDPLPRACAVASGELTAEQWPAYAASIGHRETCPETAAPVAPEHSVFGTWQANGLRLDVRADLTGTRRWVEGPCVTEDGLTCFGVAQVRFAPGPGGLVGTVESVKFQGEDGGTVSGYEPGSVTPRQGDEFVVHRVDLDVVEVENGRGEAGGGDLYLCGNLAVKPWRKRCES